MSLDPISPTGTPVVSPRVVPYLLVVGAVLMPLTIAMQDPAPWTVSKLGKLLASVVPALLGILSPGLRKSDGQ